MNTINDVQFYKPNLTIEDMRSIPKSPNTIVFTKCKKCGTSCAPSPQEKTIQATNEVVKLTFANQWTGTLSSENGLTLFYPNGEEYLTINILGIYYIFFKDKNCLPFFKENWHECPIK